jgi:threonine dehydrogenase-like Zn-dependent dehydrogenase
VILGHENAGWVHAVGPAVEHLAVGDPVICHPNLTCGVCPACRAGDDMRCARGPNLPGLLRHNIPTKRSRAQAVQSGKNSAARA